MGYDYPLAKTTKNLKLLFNDPNHDILIMDWKLMMGYMKKMMPLQFPVTPGIDVTGVVKSVGSAITKFKPGDRVVSFVNTYKGTLQEETVTEEGLTAALPDTASFEDGATIPVAGLIAYQALFDKLDLQSGERLLIQGGAGAVGMFAIQFAKNAGANVTVNASPSHNEFLKNLGVNEVIDYHDANAFKGVDKFNKILDLIGGKTLGSSYSLVNAGGAIVSTSGVPDPDTCKNLSISGSFIQTEVKPDQLGAIAEQIADNKVKVVISKQYAFNLDNVKKAFAESESGHATGKIVVTF
ncbi:NADP-dependent oxidoreductase [Lactobacillus sp. Sy-1]|uniref:NADP-dependent oxidoreductase n=1 Tax=Lactobacillus sp. Sy-1 TaxID=2109645 RepID=UPI001C5AFC06|nr:NADP-dependent oxidoreductase [Lactobacillus sp. Sy-1]MBW1606312.1 NADP-dependent oxidoreductase [Lactobacillus sp. Sy-1]